MSTVEGTVTDGDGAPIEGATVTLSSTSSSSQQSRTTDGNGDYSFSTITSDTYDVAAKRLRYENAVEEVSVGTSETVTVDFSLPEFIPKVIAERPESTGIGLDATMPATSGAPIAVLGRVDAPAGLGLCTPDDARIGGTVRSAGNWIVDTTSDGGSVGNVVQGGPGHTSTGSPNGQTIAGGSGNEVGNWRSTVGGGGGNSATGRYATVSGGKENSASGDHAAVGGGGGAFSGESNVASGDNSTVAGGSGNEASGTMATVPGGQENVANGSYSFAAGRRAEALHDGAFVWSASTSGTFSASAADQFLVEAPGGVGVGTDSPVSKLHVSGDESGSNTEPGSHVALVEDTSNHDRNEILALKTGYTLDPPAETNFVTFFDGNGDAVGAIEGTGSGGVALDSGSADFAEYLPRLDPSAAIEPGDVVGVVDGAVTRRTDGCEQALVVSDRAVVTGNSPGDTRAAREEYETVAFVGQVPTKVRGPVEEGDLVVPSGEADGTGRAVTPVEFRPGDGPVVGRAWESDDAERVSEVIVAVGLETGNAFGRVLAEQQTAIEDLERRNDELVDRIAALEAQVGTGQAPATGD